MLKSIAIPVLAAILLIGGCSAAPHPPPDMSSLFLPDPNEAKVFFYAAYDNPDDKPYFDESFRFHITDYEGGDIGDDQFIEIGVPPQNYNSHVDEVGWSGNGINSASLKEQFQAGRLYFLEAHVVSDKLVLLQTDNAQGMKDVTSRTRKCLCMQPLSQTLSNFFDF